ncbi:hypothetical protein F2P81_018737 [Scophthalmus maximus]|uniref:Uncharacterized protein n=1 Tax=Scophthalmus maximus TaxID=52904 RepID=A0A6A4SGX9_SCOMX|nr:hypothetical protein F2P81_018737 [Scophthalmus maximus]
MLLKMLLRFIEENTIGLPLLPASGLAAADFAPDAWLPTACQPAPIRPHAPAAVATGTPRHQQEHNNMPLSEPIYIAPRDLHNIKVQEWHNSGLYADATLPAVRCALTSSQRLSVSLSQCRTSSVQTASHSVLMFSE